MTGVQTCALPISPGDYYFELKAAIPKDQRFSEVRSIKFVIEKPWWQNNFLRIAAVILLLIITSGLYKWRMIKIRTKDFQKAELRLKMAEWEQTALRSQMNPHFIFNCLSSIQQLILFEKNQEANEYLLQFSKLIRSTLEISSRSFIPISEEKEYLSKYIILEQMRIPGQFDYEIIIEKNIDMKKIEIPSMIIQPIVENSIRHGMKNLINKKGMISISFEKNGKFISCTITDNGKGNDSGFFISSKRHGIRNVVQRLSILSNHYTETELFDIQNQKDAETNIIGTIVTLKMPFKEK